MTTTAAAPFRATWVHDEELAGLPAGVDPYALNIPKRDLSHEQWLTIRRTGIGSSDIATLLGINAGKATPFRLFKEKIGDWAPEDLSDVEAVTTGNDLEDYCGLRFARETGRRVRRDNFVRRCAAHPFLMANLDRLTIEGEDIVECKTSLGAGALYTDLWGDGDQDAPEAYIAQVTHEMIVFPRERAAIAALLTGPRFRIYTIPRSPVLSEMIVEVSRDFVRRLLENDPPPVTSLADAKLAYPRSREIEVQATAEIAHAVNELRIAKRDEKANKARIEGLQGKIAGFMADADTLMRGRDRLLTYKTYARDGYTVAPTTTRTMRLAGEKA